MCHKLSTQWQDGRILLHTHFTTPLSSLCRPILMYWNSKMMVRYFLSQVCFQDEVNCLFFSVWKCIGLCVFSLPISLVKSWSICVPYLSVIMKLEVWPIWNCSGSWSTAMCCVPFSTLTHACHFGRWINQITSAYNGINIFCNGTSYRFQNKEIVKNVIFYTLLLGHI